MRIILVVFVMICYYFINQGDGTRSSSLLYTWGGYTVGVSLQAVIEIVLTGGVLPVSWTDGALFLLAVLVSAGVICIYSMDLTK